MSEWEVVPYNTGNNNASAASDWVVAEPHEAPAQENTPPQEKPIAQPIPRDGYMAQVMKVASGLNGMTRPREALENRVTNVGRGFEDIVEGLGQATNQLKEILGFAPPGSTGEYTRKKDMERNNFLRTPAGQDPFAQNFREAAASTPYLALGPILGAEAGLGAKMAGSAAGNAGINALKYVPEGESRAQNTLVGLGTGAALPLIPEAPALIEKSYNALRPTSLMGRFASSPLSAAELARNLEVAEGTKTGLGNVIGSPTLQRIQENVISKIPFTGGNKALQETGKEILERGNNIVSGYLDSHGIRDAENKLGRKLTEEEISDRKWTNVAHEEIPEKLGTILETAKKENTKLKEKLYDESDKIAKESNFSLKLPTFGKLARDHIKAIESTNMLQFEPEYQQLLKKLSNYENPTSETKTIGALVDKNGKPLVEKTESKNVTLREANILAGKLGEMAEEYGQSTLAADRSAAGILSRLSKALKADIKNSIESIGNPKLKSAFSKAEKNYSENFSPLLDKDIHKFITGKKSADELLETFIKTSKSSDRAAQLEKLFKVIPEKDHDLIRASYFARAMEGPENQKVVNPNKMKTLWDNLGDRQKKILVPKASERRRLDNFSMLVDKNKKATNMMWNPNTGQMNSDLVTGLMLMNPITSLKEIGVGRGINSLLTNERSRNEIVNKLIERKGKKV